MRKPQDDIWTSSVCSSKMDEGLGVTRQPSSRRSKPDMAALVDQHRFIYSHKFKRADVSINRMFPVVDLDVLPKSPSQNCSENGEIKEGACNQRTGILTIARKRSVRQPDHTKSRKKPRPVTEPRNGSDVPITSENRPELVISVAQHSPPPTDDSESVGDTTLSTVEDNDDEDDNVPLSTFISHKPSTGTEVPISLPVSVSYSSSPSEEHLPSPSTSPITRPLCRCMKPAITDDPRWDGQFCSTECLIHTCCEAFNFRFGFHPSNLHTV
ncbi:hypothetical protein P879_03353 [Paragonimus westermani]|uniref:Uncharacterized protein n=1 Tax=Paragonimus westermani TaxID=34504 RepID=A0A8T0DK24_9TREM|nr:hypothetical protein P879_03353 [Paragonimus westermani]